MLERVRVVVTGLGVISPLGNTLKQSWTNVINGVSGVTSLTGKEYETLPCRVAALVNKQQLNIEDKFTKTQLRTMAPATILAMLSAKEAMEDAQWLPTDEIGREETGVAIGMGMVDLTDICQTNSELTSRGYNRVSPYFVPRILPNMAAGQVSIQYGLRGPNHAVSTACATGAHAVGDAYRFIKNGDAKVMICGGAESCVSPLAIAGFCRLRALSTNFNQTPQEASRPFDKDRDGFVMGEGAAVLVLEELNHALARGVDKIYGEVMGYGLSGDASHLTAPSESGRGAMLAMSRALATAQVKLDQIGYINAHATSTPLGDLIETNAIKSLFKEHCDNIQVSSTKGSHGHLLGAAGNLETLFTVMSCYTGIVPPTINLQTLDENMNLNYVANSLQKWKYIDKTLGRRIALKNSFGFGGTNASLCISEFQSD